MSIQKAEMSIEQIENGQIVEHVAYPYVEYEHVAMENGMDIMSMIRDDVSTPLVTHNTTSWKVGQGDSDVSESIVDSSVASMTIKGQTYQNILPEPSLRNSMTDGKTMQKLNEGYDSVNTVDGVCKSAILTGQTLVNVSKPAFNNGKINEQYSLIGQITDMVKVNNTYYFKIFNKTNTALKCYISKQVATDLFSFNINANSFFSGTFTTKNEFTGNAWLVNDENQTVKQDVDIILIDYQEGMENWDIPYFNGMQSVKLPVLTTVGKNLFDGEGLYAAVQAGQATGGLELLINGLKIKKNTKYSISFKYETDTDRPVSSYCVLSKINQSLDNHNELYVFNQNNSSNGNSLNTRSLQFNSGDFEYLYLSASSITPTTDGYISYSDIQVEEGSTATPFEPYKSNILTVNEPIELRGIGDVKDTLDCLTGEVVENTIKLTFSGIENWETSTNLTNYMTFRLAKPSNMITADSHSNANKYVCDKLQIVSSNTVGSTEIEAIWFSTGHMYIRLPKTKASSLEEFKTYLSTNNIQVVSCAKQPVVKTVDLSILDQDNQPTTQLNSFANGYIQVSSQGLIPSVDYEVPTSNSYHVDLMKPNTQYTMKNMRGTFTIDGIQYNASVNGTFTSPSTLSNRLMITNMVQTQPMLLEGDMTNEEVPYVEGIKSAFEDESKIEVLSTGKNLFDGSLIPYNGSEYNDFKKAYATSIQPILKLKPNTTYYIHGEITQIPNHNSIFKFVDSDGVEIQGTYVSMNNTGGNDYKKIIVNNKFTTKMDGNIYFNTFPAYSQEDLNKLKSALLTSQIQIEEGTTATVYEPYKSNNTKIPLLSPSRGLPNGVRDEIVLDRVNHKAKIIQRVGEDLTQLDTPIVTEVNLEGYPYVYKGGHIFLNTEIAPITEVTYSINQAHQIESSNEDILRHQNEINHLYELIAQYVQVQYEAELIDIALQG